MTNERVAELHRLMAEAGNAEEAAAQQAYHKSPLNFHGIKTERQKELVQQVFPEAHYTREEHLPIISELWRTEWFDERMAALTLLERARRLLTPPDLDGLKAMADSCQGWAELDSLALRVLSPMAVDFETAVYKPVRQWVSDEYMWTRRAAILLHIVPARRQRLIGEFAWPSLEERLHEEEFFIRKAIGWTLREISKHYPREVFGFLKRVGERASPLTRREGARNLPDELRMPLLGK